MSRITYEDVTAEPWKYNANQWRYAHDIHIPHIAEISPMQYAHLSKAGRRRYDAKRSDEWEASAQGYADWQAAVLAAYDNGTITRHTEGIHPDARNLIIDTEIDRRKQREEEERKQRITAAQYQDISEIEKGAEVFIHTLRLWVTVKKINRKTVTVSHPFGDMSIPPQQLYRADPRTL